MFALALLYYLFTICKMNIMNVSYEITPPMVEDTNNTYTDDYYEIIPPSPIPEYTQEYIQDVRMRVAIERFASFDEYMEVPRWREEKDDISDDCTVCYDEEVYRFNKCGEIEGCYDYSEFYELETIVPEQDDYQLSEDERNMVIDYDYDYNQEEENYHNDPEYWQEMRYERMMDMVQERDWD